jgi:ankyrin repeat protein
VNNQFTRACGQGRSSVALDQLREQGAEIDYRDRVNCTPLHHAAFEGRLDTVRYLIAAGADLHAADHFFGTPLCLAAIKGHLAVVNLFIESNVNLNQDCEHLGTAAHAACTGGNLAVVKVLADNGANFKAQAWVSGVLGAIVEKGYRTVWDFPAYRQLSLCTKAARSFVNCSPGAVAVDQCHRAVVEFCLNREHGLSANETLEEIVFADIARSTITDRETGISLIMVAVTELDPQILGLLLARGGAATSVRSSQLSRVNAIAMAVVCSKNEVGFEPCVRLLLQYGCNIDARHDGEVTALMLATRQVTGPARAQVLIGMGASINLVDATGESALMYAVHYSPAETQGQCVRLLCHLGADVNAKDSSGRTALDLARERTGSDYGEVQSTLLRYDAARATSYPAGSVSPSYYGGYPSPSTSPTNQVVPRRSGTMRTLSMAFLSALLASEDKGSGSR